MQEMRHPSRCSTTGLRSGETGGRYRASRLPRACAEAGRLTADPGGVGWGVIETVATVAAASKKSTRANTAMSAKKTSD